ncbi:phage tail sheath family protein [Ideonella sp. YS5]|uniref:phage tail sheath family protein n=1 Tax=Ideonella sp. YS5 TaxID=3453714 RepID=UPI003EEAC2DF
MRKPWIIDETAGGLSGLRIGTQSRMHLANLPPDRSTPIFIGFGTMQESAPARRGLGDGLVECRRMAHFDRAILPHRESYLRAAVRGYFANGGSFCLVQAIPPRAEAAERAKTLTSLMQRGGLLEDRTDVDLVCIPDAAHAHGALAMGEADRMTVREAQVRHCEDLGNRFAILDGPEQGPERAAESLHSGLRSGHAAMYFPWLVPDPAWKEEGHQQTSSPQWRHPPLPRAWSAVVGRAVPACGHVAGVYARAGREAGVQRAPANMQIEDALDVSCITSPDDEARLGDDRINVLVCTKSRGIRVAGARTLSREPRWAYVSTARVVIGLRRWLEHAMRDLAFEPATPQLRERLRLRISERCREMWRAGELVGADASEAFEVRCDEALNPPEGRDLGQVVAEIRLATCVPAEYIEVRILLDANRFTLTGR